jgi:hypothetical protein
MNDYELTLKQRTALVLYAHGYYSLCENLIGSEFYANKHWKRQHVSLGWTYRLTELGLIYSASNTTGLESVWHITPEGEEVFSTFTPREVYEAKARLRRIGYHFTSDPIEAWDVQP